MNQEERLNLLLDYLIAERQETINIPADYDKKRVLLRALVNLRPPRPVSEGFISIQDDFLQEESERKGIVTLGDIPGTTLRLWQGDITRLAADAIVNAANAELLGCFVPGHHCIDNAIHTASGVQLREECNRLMQQQGHPEETGKAKITKGYNLPAKYVIHTVGPVVQGQLTNTHMEQLSQCYNSCIDVAAKNNINSIAFCCISTGVFGFPKEPAANIAVSTVKKRVQRNESLVTVIFNVFTDEDFRIYSKLLAE